MAPFVRRRHFAGFTAIELAAAMGIVAILAVIAAPNLARFFDQYRVRHASESLKAAIYFARTEAIRRAGNVTLRKASSTQCPTTGPTDWSCGWIVFADTNANGVHDAGEELIQTSPPTSRVKVTIVIPNPSSYLKINRWGRFNETVNAFSFRLEPVKDGGNEAHMTLCVNSGGRLRTVHGAGGC
ncbi:GspH/FimT family pseudopilin [Variovorax sp. HW608]|uniref:GspH/FimT family pseudopilin n=1 Tax=Variovorax sp. HW608 TaxID=1034889 RepID=UPI00155FA0AD|nr:GspH/FimT family pseudopilin [Variovorax sp. HW608]